MFALLAEYDTPALASMAPERVFYISSFAKAVAPGLRMGFVRAPDPLAAEQVAAAVGLSTRMAPTLYVELACQWMNDGTLGRIVTAHRAELEHRVQIARHTLQQYELQSSRFGPHLWLRLPPKQRESEVVRATAAAGVNVVASQEFSIRGQSCHALRITVTAPRTHEELHRGLCLLRNVIR